MSYLEQILEDGEVVTHKARVHWIILLRPVLYLAIGLVLVWLGDDKNFPILEIIGGLFLLFVPINYVFAILTIISTEIAVTNRRIITKIGFIRRHTSEIDRTKVEGISVDQSILGRILGYGTVTVTGTGGKSAPMRSIANPVELRTNVRAQ